jgi:hypothetical protein
MASDLDVSEEDKEEAKQRLQERYKEKTGHELPGHVVENMRLLSTTTLTDIAEIHTQQQRLEAEQDDDITTAEVYGLLGQTAVSGLTGVLASGFFDGWATQLTGGFFSGLLTFVLIGVLWWVLRGDAA